MRLSSTLGSHWAVAYRNYSDDYVAAEDEARTIGAGIWSSQFVMPWDWRRGVRVVQQDDASAHADGCDIKGNINRDGEMIYHVPGGRWYERTRVDESAGERWFCTDAEALAAGWRRSVQ